MKAPWIGRRIAALGTVLLLLGCGDVLKVVDPDIILEAESPQAALALRNGVFLRLSQAVNGTQGPDALFVFAGLMADEWRSGDTFVQRNNQDQRVFQPDNTFNSGPYRALNRIRVAATQAIGGLRRFWPDSTAAVASMFALTAYSEVLIGEHYCNGTPLSGLDGTTIIFGDPLTNDSVFALAIASADSALALAGPTPAGQRWSNFASIVKGRALLDRGQFAAAAAAVAGVPTMFQLHAYHSVNTNDNQIWALNNSARRYTLTNGREGGVGIDFVTSNDPRLPRQVGGAVVFDNSVPMTLVRQALYGQHDSVPLATGIEARLIEAEAQLQTGGDRNVWLTTINTLRTDTLLYPRLGTGFAYGTSIPKGAPLAALADPPSDSARLNIHFSERAFWMFSTGHRLGDLRRLVRQYGRGEAEAYPNGAFIKGGTYSDAVQMPVPFDEVNNPNFTACFDRNP
jgi:hypothetical protein